MLKKEAGLYLLKISANEMFRQRWLSPRRTPLAMHKTDFEQVLAGREIGTTGWLKDGVAMALRKMPPGIRQVVELVV